MPISSAGATDAMSPYSLHLGDALDAYSSWETPDLIISDGAYGVKGFPGDPATPDGLPEWYAPHVKAWSEHAKSSTTLWFWNTEVGWATVHPLLVANGWEYVQLVTWDKGIAHVAGNVNGQTIRQLPVVTEVAALYRRIPRLIVAGIDEPIHMRDWLRREWRRAGLTLAQANDACGTKSAASRKYLTSDHQWYMPDADMMSRLIDYAEAHGKPDGRPYFSMDGTSPLSSEECVTVYQELRAKWNHEHGITNVWQYPPLSGRERVRTAGKSKMAHLNQKPLELMARQIRLASDERDIVWEPFGGLASASVAAVTLGRRAFVAECNPDYAPIARQRLEDAASALQSSVAGT